VLTADRMAVIARACWPDATDPWTPRMIESLLASPGAFAVCRTEGFALMRVSGEEAELLSLDVLPIARHRGIASGILQEALRRAASLGAREVYLEVDTGNAPARALYDRAGFETRGLRKNYYRRSDGRMSDALVMVRFLDQSDMEQATDARPDPS
jgi:ribosomal-protein-alanine N-acetyltransferase